MTVDQVDTCAECGRRIGRHRPRALLRTRWVVCHRCYLAYHDVGEGVLSTRAGTMWTLKGTQIVRKART